MKDTIEICIDCGEKYIKKHPSQKRCKECQLKHDKELHAEAGKRRNKIKYAPIVRNPHTCKKAKTCIYGGTTGGLHICDYMAKTGRPRGCPVQDCKRYERRK